MSELLDALILQRKQQALEYKVYLGKIVELTKRASHPEIEISYPSSINSAALRALFDNLETTRISVVRERPPHYGDESATDSREATALAVDNAIRRVKKADWRGNRFKEREVRNAIRSELGGDEGLVDAVFEIVKNQRDY